jgi:N-acetylglutamate synthase-like GNAT family acetyltransferase
MTQIELLADYSEHIPELAQLWYEELSRHWNPQATIEKATQLLINHMNKEQLPLAFVAFCDNQPIGMACLRDTDGIRPSDTPWLGSLVVHPNYRGSMVGETLINKVKNVAKSLGYSTLYLLAFDPTLPNWYTRLGWKFTGHDKLLGHPVTVMSIDL